MKVVCNGYELAEAVNKVIKAVGSKTVNPVLEGIKIEAKDDAIKLTATDMELAIERVIPAEVKIEGATVVPGRLFSEFVKKLNMESIEISQFEERRMKIRYRESEGTLNCLPADEYPIIKKLDKAKKYRISGKSLKDIVNSVSFSVSTDDSRPVLKGVLFEIEGNEVTAVAIDGYRLAKVVGSLEESDGGITAIIPARSLNEISRLIEDDEQIIDIYLQRNYMAVDFAYTSITTRLIEGDFINYKQIIPQRFETMVTLSKDEFDQGLERAILLSRTDRNNLVRFDMHEGIMNLSSNSEAGDVAEKIDIKLDGHDLSIAFNARYFTEIIKYVDTECMTIKFNDSVQPCVVVPTGGTKDVLYLVLPVRMM